MTTEDVESYANLTHEEIVKFKETFLKFDVTGVEDEATSLISIKDLSIVMRSLGFSPTEAELKDIVVQAEKSIPFLDQIGKLSILVLKMVLVFKSKEFKCISSFK